MKQLTVIFLFASVYSSAQSLEDYQQIVTENNPGLQAKYKEFEAAMQWAAQVSTLPDPNLSFGYFISPVETRVGPQQARISLNQMFPWFGMLRAQEDAAGLQAEAKYQSFIDARNGICFQVADAYYPLYELHRLIEIESENIKILESYKSIITSKFENNTGSLSDVLRVDIMLNEALTNLEIFQEKKVALLSRFNNLLNRSEGASVAIPDTLEDIMISGSIEKDLLFVKNPVLNELDMKRQASEARERAALRQGLPKIGVGLDYVIVGERTDMDIEDNGKNVLMPMVTVSLPIFRSKYKAAQKEAQLMQENYLLQKADLNNRLSGSFDMTWFEVQKQNKLIQLYRQQITESRQTLSLLFKAYANSEEDFEDILSMQQQILKYEKLLAGAETEMRISLAKLDYIIGSDNVMIR